MSLFGKKSNIDMVNGPFFKKLLLFAVPVMLTGFLQLLYNSADLIVVGKFSPDGSTAQAAISSTSSLIHLIINVSMGLAVGINVAVAQNIGAKNSKNVSEVVHTAVALSIITGIAVGLFGFFLSRTFLEWMGNEVLDLSSLYLEIYFIGTPFNLLYNFGAAILRAKGETQKPLIYLAVSGLINIALNLFFVLVLNKSVEGVAIATVASQAVSAILVVIELMRTDGYCHLDIKKIRIHKKPLIEIVKYGVPAGIQGSMFSVSNVIIQSTINSYGEIIMAANGNAASIEAFLNVAVDCVYQAALSFIGQNYGANRKDNIEKIMRTTFYMMTVICFIVATITIFGRTLLLSLFSNDAEVIKQGELRIIVNCATYFIYGWMQLFVGFMRGLGHGILPVFVSIIGICVFRIFWIYVIYPLEPTMFMVYLSYPISWVLTGLAHFICVLAVKKRSYIQMQKTFEERVFDV